LRRTSSTSCARRSWSFAVLAATFASSFESLPSRRESVELVEVEVGIVVIRK
jgi:hypothetical protein